MNSAEHQMKLAEGYRREIAHLKAGLEVVKSVAKLATYKEFEDYFEKMSKLINTKLQIALSMDVPESDLPIYDRKRDHLLVEAKTLKRIAEAPVRAKDEVPLIEAQIQELDEMAAGIEQKWSFTRKER